MGVDIAEATAAGTGPPAPRGGWPLLALYTAASLVTASLLFVVQPMVARMVLPAFGGSPQVWTTAMLFFQAALLAGYGYTHVTTTRVPAARQPIVHLTVMALPLLLLPISLSVAPSGRGGAAPSLELLAGLTLGVAAPFLLIATSGPLLQRWLSWTDHPLSADPYPLYAAGNVGSIGGLLLYPFVLEPRLSVAQQSRLWALGYVVAYLALIACAVPAVRGRRRGARSGAPQRPELSPPLGGRRVVRWVWLAFLPSSAMLAVTTYLSTDVAAVPMLWVLPLAVYLATFVIAFSASGPRARSVADRIAVPAAVAALAVTVTSSGLALALVAQLLFVMVTGLACHGRLAGERPPPVQLTRFYVVLAVGGALGGLANGIVAPLLFPVVIEHGLVAAALAWVVAREQRSPLPGLDHLSVPNRVSVTILAAAVPVGAVLVSFGWHPLPDRLALPVVLLLIVALMAPFARSGAVAAAVTLLALVPGGVQLAQADLVERTFFGVHRVIETADARTLLHGTTVHGEQLLERPEVATAYYAADGPFGDLADIHAGEDVGVIGLGTGAIAAYGSVGQRIVFHEIDPSIVDIASDRFTFIEDSAADVDVVLGDGRLTLADRPVDYALLAVDAFSSDSIPVHLLTVEAMATYREAVGSAGSVALHLSNRYLDLLPVVAGSARALDVPMLVKQTDEDSELAFPALWVVLTDDAERLEQLRDRGWSAPERVGEPWTDQRSDLWSVVVR